jgi:hypothetical protein
MVNGIGGSSSGMKAFRVVAEFMVRPVSSGL